MIVEWIDFIIHELAVDYLSGRLASRHMTASNDKTERHILRLLKHQLHLIHAFSHALGDHTGEILSTELHLSAVLSMCWN